MFESFNYCTLAVHLVTEHIERFSFGVGTFHFSKQKEVHINVPGGWGGSVFNCLRKQRVGGQ